MASSNRTKTDAVRVLEELQRNPFRFSFYQALRRLECAHPDQPRVGQALRPGDEPVRLAQEVSLSFAPSTVRALRFRQGRAPRLEVAFLGLFGPNGPLPLHMTEYARDRMRNADDPTFVRFVDMFHHRMLSLFYRVWSAAQPTVQYDRPESDRFALYVGALAGLGQPTLRGRDAMPDLAKWFFSGHLSCPTRHADGLVAMLQEFFDLPMRLQEFVGHWVRLPEENRGRLGVRGASTLSQSALIGERIWDCQQRFRIHIGPLDLPDYLRLLPGGESLPRLAAIVRNYVGEELSWELKLTLKKEEVPRASLGRLGQLGWTTWLKSRPMPQDASDLVLNPRRVREELTTRSK